MRTFSIGCGRQEKSLRPVSSCRWFVATVMSFALVAACNAKTAEGVRQDNIDAFEMELILGGPPERVRAKDRPANATLEAEYLEGEQDGYFVGSYNGLLAGRSGENCEDMNGHELIDSVLGYDAGKTNGYSDGYAEACAEGYEEFLSEQSQQEEDQ